MDLTVQWSNRAELEFDNILDYWNKRNGSERYSKKLMELVDQSIEGLAKYPESGRLTDNQSVRYKIVKDYFLYYSYDKNHVIRG